MPRYRQVEELEEAISPRFGPLRITAPADLPFHTDMASASIGPMGIIRFTHSPGQVRRLPQLINSGDPRLILVTLQRRGHAIVSQDGRQCQPGPGDLVAYDTSRPYDIFMPDYRDIAVIMMPYEMLGPSGDRISARTAVPVPGDHGIQSVIGTFFAGLANSVVASNGDELRGTDHMRLADAAASLLISAFADIPCERVELHTSLTDRILAYALANLHDPGLTVGSAARRFGISPRYLHKLMRDRDIQFAAWVRRERMKRIRQDLLDPHMASRTAAVIAARWGLCNPDHLSRSLRAEFGQNVAEIRTRAGG